MDKIAEFRVDQLTISGFKGNETPVSFNFGDITLISGEVRTGKTSIAEAIAFAITGQGFWGGRQIDRLYNMNNPDIRVSLTYRDASGLCHQLDRHRYKDRMEVVHDGVPVRQVDLDQIFGGADEFLSLFNPLYFIQILGDQGRELLEKNLPPVSHENVLEQLNDENRFLLQDEHFTSIESYLKSLRAEKKELLDGDIAYDGQLSLISSQKEDRESQKRIVSAELCTVKDKIKSFEEKQLPKAEQERLQQKFVDLSLQYDNLQSEMKGQPRQNYSEKVQVLMQEIESRKHDTYQSKFAKDIACLLEMISNERNNYNRLKGFLLTAKPGGCCPVCQRPFTEQNMSELQEAVMGQLKEVTQRGKQLKSQLLDLQEIDRKCKEKFCEFQNEDIEKKQRELTEIQQVAKESQNNLLEHSAILRDLQTQIDAVDEAISLCGLSPEQAVELEQFRRRENELGTILSAIDQTDPAQQEHVILERKKQLAARLDEVNRKISAAMDYTDKRCSLLFEPLNSGKLCFKLYEVVKKTGELKRVFKVKFDGKDFCCLSRSETVEAGTELTGMLRSILGRRYPLFLDDAESLAPMPRPDTQMIIARVIHKTPLTIRQLTVPKSKELKKAG